MSEVIATYDKDGIKIVLYWDIVSFHKNGLRIDLPLEALQEFVKMLELESAKLDIENAAAFAKLFGGKS